MLILLFFHLIFASAHSSSSIRCILCKDCNNLSALNFVSCDNNNFTTVAITTSTGNNLVYKDFVIANPTESKLACYVSN